MDKRVVVLGAQVPFVRGGAELLVEGLVDEINERLPGVSADRIQIPFKWYPEEQIIRDVAAWRLLDVSESDGEKIDLCIATKFPTYAARHPNKVAWLVHQHRQFYDLERSKYDVPNRPEIDRIVRQKIKQTDTQFLGECQSIYSISETVGERLLDFNGLESTPVYPPPPLGDRIKPGEYGDYLLYVGRLEKIKRVELLLHALEAVPSAKAIIVGTGKHRDELVALSRSLGLGERCTFEGYVSDERYVELLANSRAVFYSPVDEDYGYATVEAFSAVKPVITTADSGEVAKLVEKTGSGWVAREGQLEMKEIVHKVCSMSASEMKKVAMEGKSISEEITWKTVFEKIILPYL